jgi:hypothetical protein
MTTGLEKPKRYRNPKYLAWIREQPCCSCGQSGTLAVPIVAHHARNLDPGRPTQSKVSDYDAVPLCQMCHNAEHTGYIGERMEILELYQSAFHLLRTYMEGLDG